jgi:hypothetical protein
VKRASLALLACFVVACAPGDSPEPAKVRVTTWNLEWFPSGSAHDATPEIQAQRIAAAADVLSTVGAVRDREAISIAERKQRLTSIFGNIAEIVAERMEELAGTASLRDAGITAGIATDKLLALCSDPLSQANNYLHVHLERVDLMGQFNEMLKQLGLEGREAKDTAAKALPSGQDPEPTQLTATTQPADASAGEEKDRAKGE